jgi:hypothetical protein
MFWGCNKESTADIIGKTHETAIRPISVDEVKTWYKGKGSQNSLNTRSAVTTPFGVTPLFSLAFSCEGNFSDSTYSGRIHYVTTPTYHSAITNTDKHRGSFMLFHKDETGAIRSRFVVFMADPLAYADPSKVIDLKTFTGRVLMFDEDNMLVSDELFSNGSLTEVFHGKLHFKSYFEGLKSQGGNTLNTRDGVWDWIKCLFSPNSQGCGGCPSASGSSGRKPTSKKPNTSSDDNAGDDYEAYTGNFFADDTPFSWTPVNNNPPSGSSSSGNAVDVKTQYCNNLASGWEDEKLQAILDGEMPASAYTGYLSSSPAEELAYRNKLRELQVNGFNCEDIYEIKDNKDVGSAIHSYYVGKGKSIAARDVATGVLRHMRYYPQDIIVLNYHVKSFFDKYLPAGFTVGEFVKLASDPQLFAKVEEILTDSDSNQKSVFFNELKNYINSSDYQESKDKAVPVVTNPQDPNLNLSMLEMNPNFDRLSTDELRRRTKLVAPNLDQWKINISAGRALEEAYSKFVNAGQVLTSNFRKGFKSPIPLDGRKGWRWIIPDFIHPTQHLDLNTNETIDFPFGGVVEVKAPQNEITLSTSNNQIEAEVKWAGTATDNCVWNCLKSGNYNSGAYTLVLPYGSTYSQDIVTECTKKGVTFYVSYAFIEKTTNKVVFSNPERKNYVTGQSHYNAPVSINKKIDLDLVGAVLRWEKSNNQWDE